MRRPRAKHKKLAMPTTTLILLLVALSIALYFTALYFSEAQIELNGAAVPSSLELEFEGLERRHPAASRVDRADFVVVIPTDERHLPLVRASRAQRKGTRALVAVNDTRLVDLYEAEGRQHNETWVAYPDDSPERGRYPGDTRAAVVPFLAFQVLGPTFKWLLYGDDDTQWFLDGAIKLARTLDPDLPYFVTDNLWWSSINGTIGYQPNLEAPRCLPCGFSAYGNIEGEMPFNAPEGCPCTPRALCAADKRGVFDADCSMPLNLQPVFSSRTYSIHGGAGGMVSIGLLQAVSLAQMERCIEAHGRSTGGDAFISICLWRLGYAHTDPGPWFNDPVMRLFDAGNLRVGEVADKLEAASVGACDTPRCEDLLGAMVSTHMHSREFPSMQGAANMSARISAAYELFSGRSAPSGAT